MSRCSSVRRPLLRRYRSSQNLYDALTGTTCGFKFLEKRKLLPTILRSDPPRRQQHYQHIAASQLAINRFVPTLAGLQPLRVAPNRQSPVHEPSIDATLQLSRQGGGQSRIDLFIGAGVRKESPENFLLGNGVVRVASAHAALLRSYPTRSRLGSG